MPRTSLSPPEHSKTRTPAAPVWPGVPYPLGAHWDGHGVNFAVYSESATAIDVILFDEPHGPETSKLRLPETTAHVFHGYVDGLKPGQLYGLRVHGPWEPEKGHRFNAAKLLVDPYARALSGRVDPGEPILAYVPGEGGDLKRDDRDSARGVPKAVVLDESFDWGGDAPPRTPWNDTIIYELHVKGFSHRNPAIPEAIRGKYAALAHPASIEHFRRLGVTAVELLPVHQSATDGMLSGRGLTDYWGYNTLGYFATDARFSSEGDRGGQVRELKSTVKALHAAGIEVILDVVYNHTCEGNHLGPTLSLRGLDNAVYYRLVADQPRYYMDYTGCGNSLNMRHPQTLKLIMDSLRYWVTEMHVDGFRFDLASTLARELHDVDRLSAFFDIIHQDPIISSVKLIAEPWDVGEGGYQVGNFPLLWTEWNGKYRDEVRSFWNGYDPQVKELASRLTGSSDLYQSDGRRPYASINFVTAHDGFTLHDLVTYAQKHNEANGEEGRDGADDNASNNFGVEGETDNEHVVALRERQKRNFLATLFLSQGVAMLVAGDEMGRTQRGNNNGYCQDSELSWLDWSLDDHGRGRALREFTEKLIAFRHQHPVLRRKRFFQGIHFRGSEAKDLAWFRPDGNEMDNEDWEKPTRQIAFLLGGDAIPSIGVHGERVVDDTLLVILNGERQSVRFRLPALEWAASWERAIDTAQGVVAEDDERHEAASEVELEELSIQVYVAIRKT